MEIPEDISDVFSFLRMMRSEFSDVMSCQVTELFDELREDIQYCKENNQSVDWDYYRACVNDMCNDDGMPKLCDDPTG